MAADPGPVGLVLAGGGARGAYELGALAELLPHLGAADQPRIVLGTSVGALNAAFFAATADQPLDERLEAGEKLWGGIHYGDVLEPLVSFPELGRLGGLLAGRPPSSLLDPAPLTRTLPELIPFGRIRANVGDTIDTVAVAATSGATSLSVVFHEGGASPPHDPKRGIDYVAAELGPEHVLASAAIPVLFPAVEVEGHGWFFDGGTRLNTPIKPALALGARRLIVIALNSPATRDATAPARRPDALEAAGQLVQAVLVDPLVNDVRTLATVNALVESGGGDGKHEVIPYILVAPEDPDAIGRLAQKVFREHYSSLAETLRERDLALLGRLLDAGASPAHAELLSYVFFAPEFAEALIAQGRSDARAWIAGHPGDPWQRAPLEP